MKILYSVQATGNGHISRALDLIPYLKKYGEVDFFLSGANYSLDLPNALYKSEGIGFFYDKKGQIDYLKTMRKFKPFRAIKEANELPVEKYDAVINDFESITAMACKKKSKFSVGFGHQASFQFPTVPMAKKFDPIGRYVLKNYAKCDKYVGLHFNNYDWNNVYTPVLSDKIVELGKQELSKEFTMLVYLPSYANAQIIDALESISKYCPIDVFSSEGSWDTETIKFHKPDKSEFIKKMSTCTYVITSAGFETPAEALYLGKQLVVVPIRGQYEQACNAEALRRDFNVPVAKNLKDLSEKLNDSHYEIDVKRLTLSHSTEQIVEAVMQKFK